MCCYTLPLFWRGIPIRMSCPLRKQSSPNPPMVTCHPVGMVVKTAWTPPASKIKVNINGDWEPLTKAIPRCGFNAVAHPEGVVLFIRNTPCLEKKDGMYNIGLFGDDGETKISCPSWLAPPADPIQTPPKFSYNPPNSGNPHVPPSYPPSLFHPWKATPPPSIQGKEPLYHYSSNIKHPYAPPEWNPTTSPPVQTTRSQTWLPYFPFPVYPQPPKQETPPTHPKPASDVVGHTLHGINAEFSGQWEPQSMPTLPKPPVSEGPLGQTYQSLYHFPPSFAGQSPYETRVPPTQQTRTPASMYQEHKPQPLKHPGGSTFETHENQYYPLNYYSQTVFPFPPWPEKPFVAPEPPITPQPETPKGQIKQLHDLYYYLQQSKNPQSVALPPAPQTPSLIVHPSDPRPMDSVLSQSSYTGMSQYHQPPALYLPSVQCPQVCPTGISNCCPQISFHQHQHLHHIVPVGNDGKDNTPINPGPPVASSVAHSGFDYDLVHPQYDQKPNEEQETEVDAASPPASHQFLAVGMRHKVETHLQPPDGNIVTQSGSNPSKGTDPGQVYQHFEPNLQYSYRPVLSQDGGLQGPAETFSGLFSKPHYNSVKPESQYEPNNLLENYPLLPQNTRHSFEPNLMDINKRVQLQPSTYGNAKRPMPITEPDLYLFPHPMLQDAQTPTVRKLSIPKHSSPMPQLVNGLKKPTKREGTDWAHLEPKNYRLLGHGPPDSEFRKSPLPPGEGFGQSDSTGPQDASNPRNNPQHPQNLKHQKSEPPKWLDGKASDFDFMPSPSEKSESLLFSASDVFHAVPLSQEPLVGATNLKAEVESFKDLWKVRRVPDKGFPVKPLQHWSSASDNQQNGLYQPVRKKENMKQQRPEFVNK